jgi:hypothetical protein
MPSTDAQRRRNAAKQTHFGYPPTQPGIITILPWIGTQGPELHAHQNTNALAQIVSAKPSK